MREIRASVPTSNHQPILFSSRVRANLYSDCIAVPQCTVLRVQINHFYLFFFGFHSASRARVAFLFVCLALFSDIIIGIYGSERIVVLLPFRCHFNVNRNMAVAERTKGTIKEQWMSMIKRCVRWISGEIQYGHGHRRTHTAHLHVRLEEQTIDARPLRTIFRCTHLVGRSLFASIFVFFFCFVFSWLFRN